MTEIIKGNIKFNVAPTPELIWINIYLDEDYRVVQDYLTKDNVIYYYRTKTRTDAQICYQGDFLDYSDDELKFHFEDKEGVHYAS